MTHSYLLLGLTVPLALVAVGCDLEDKSIGDSGAPMDSDGNDDDGLACTEIGCTDGLTIDLLHGQLASGQWEVSILPQDGGAGETCGFVVDADGVIGSNDCNALFAPDRISITAAASYEAVDVTVTVDGFDQGSASEVVAYQEVQPNGPDCPPICIQGSVDVQLTEPSGPTCEDLGGAYVAELAAVQACNDAAECGQTLDWGSCGCTRAPVVRLDADIGPLQDLWDAGLAVECPFTQVGSTCDCPEADGFACIDNACTWNYL